MLNELLVSGEKSNFFKLFTSENDKPKPIRFILDSVNVPFGLEKYNDKYILNFEINESENCNTFVEAIKKMSFKRHVNYILKKIIF